MKVYISDSGFDDLGCIKDYYVAEQIPHIGEEFVVSIVRHIETLIDNPNIGRMVPEFEKEKIRELIHPPFRIVYLRESDSIHVVRVWRSERLLVLPET
ncbi:MAG: type II toxin-antitoxin system RelE/ParE family toxin [Gammaproteobacteria bacterium]|nr:MAG: type II toxin-antitoxin system RelE/ParE family toxin [Gammaproteobacteria bacterium]